LELLERIGSASQSDGAVLEKKAWVLWLLHRYDDAAGVARDALEMMPDSELCLRRLIEYETLMGNPHQRKTRRSDPHEERVGRRVAAIGVPASRQSQLRTSAYTGPELRCSP
jgi:hypothetical protein